MTCITPCITKVQLSDLLCISSISSHDGFIKGWHVSVEEMVGRSLLTHQVDLQVFCW